MSVEGLPASLIERAQNAHVVVVGGGVAGLVAALECARVGIRVTVLEEASRLGGAIRSAEVDGLVLDVGAESYATRGGHVRALVEELGLADRVVRPVGGPAWLAGLPGAAPLPGGGVLGIPANPFAPEVRRIIGWRGVWRAYLDRVRPPLTIGHERSLGRLVRTRMGEAVLERLVAPVVSGVYSAHPDDIDVDLAAPGLNGALTSTGSLSSAVVALRGDRPAGAAPGAAVEGLAGGMGRLVEALRERLGELGAQVRTGVRVRALATDGEAWRVTADGDDPGDETLWEADAVIVAAGEGASRALLATVIDDLLPEETAEPPIVEVVTLVLDAPALDAAPRGSGVLTVPGSHRAKALTHASAKWEWVRDAAGARHVVRLSFGSQGEPPASEALDGEALAALALEEAAALLGVPLPRTALLALHRERYAQSQPAAALGRAERTARLRDAVGEVDGLEAAGAWLAGTGLAQVVPDARAAAERARAHVLWD